MPRAPHWFPAYIGIGSNLDGPVHQVEAAFDALAELPGTRLCARSSLYRSAPFGGVEQADFVNAVAGLMTQLSPVDLLAELKAVQRRHGREVGGQRWGPRVLDLDLLLYAREQISSPELSLPHPGIGERNFVLLPLADIAPGLFIPGLGHLAGIEVGRVPAISRIG